MTAQQLADAIGMTQGHVSRIENSKRGLSIPVAKQFAAALEATVQDVMGLDGLDRPRTPTMRDGGFSDEAVPYVASGRESFMLRKGLNVDPWEIKTDAVNNVGIVPGDIVDVDISADTVEHVKPLKIVIAQIYDTEELTKARTVVRQFIPPSLLITNSAAGNAPILDIDKGEAYIKGVVVGIHRNMG